MEINSNLQERISIKSKVRLPLTAAMASWVDRVEQERLRLGWSKIELARRAGIEPARIYKFLDDKVEKPRGDSMQRVASALRVSEIWLQFGMGPRFLSVPLVGYLAAGEEFYPVDDHAKGAGLDEVSLELDAADPIAIRVRGDSMIPVYRPGDDLLCSRMAGTDARAAIGQDCAIMTKNGAGYVKLLRWSPNAGFVLRSYNSSFEDIENVDIDWVAPIKIIRRLS